MEDICISNESSSAHPSQASHHSPPGERGRHHDLCSSHTNTGAKRCYTFCCPAACSSAKCACNATTLPPFHAAHHQSPAPAVELSSQLHGCETPRLPHLVLAPHGPHGYGHEARSGGAFWNPSCRLLLPFSCMIHVRSQAPSRHLYQGGRGLTCPLCGCAQGVESERVRRTSYPPV